MVENIAMEVLLCLSVHFTDKHEVPDGQASIHRIQRPSARGDYGDSSHDEDGEGAGAEPGGGAALDRAAR